MNRLFSSHGAGIKLFGASILLCAIALTGYVLFVSGQSSNGQSNDNVSNPATTKLDPVVLTAQGNPAPPTVSSYAALKTADQSLDSADIGAITVMLDQNEKDAASF